MAYVERGESKMWIPNEGIRFHIDIGRLFFFLKRRTLLLKVILVCLAERLSVEIDFGVVKSKQSIWRLKTITDFFWAIVKFIGVFFASMFSMEKSDAYRKGSGSGKKWDGGAPGDPGGGPYGGGPQGPPRRGLDNVRGLDSVRQDHNALPACGSCCG